MKPFSEIDIRSFESGHFWFECGMISTCCPLFDHCDSNHDVEDELRKNKVLRKNNSTDTESSALVVLFTSKKAGIKFVERLNAYLTKKELTFS